MNCQEARLELDAELPRESRRAALAAHLAQCAACRTHAERLASVDAGLAAHFGSFAPRPEFDTRLRAAIARAQHERAASREASLVPVDAAPMRRRLRAGSILDACAAVGVAGTVLGLALHEHATLARWFAIAASGQLGGVALPGIAVIGALTAAAVAAIAAGAYAWTNARRV